MLDLEIPEPSRATGNPLWIILIPQDLHSATQMQDAIVGKIGYRQTGFGIGRNITQGIEQAVALVVWNAQGAVFQNGNEASLATTM